MNLQSEGDAFFGSPGPHIGADRARPYRGQLGHPRAEKNATTKGDADGGTQ